MTPIFSRILKLLGLAGLLLSLPAAAGEKLVVGQPALPAKITLMDRSVVTLQDLRGQVVVINFWATWCVPCRTELPLLDTYYRLQQKHGLRVFAVTVEGSVSATQLKPLFGTLAITPARGISRPYRPIENYVPSNYIIDRAGRVRYMKAGAFDIDDLNRELVPLLREPAP